MKIVVLLSWALAVAIPVGGHSQLGPEPPDSQHSIRGKPICEAVGGQCKSKGMCSGDIDKGAKCKVKKSVCCIPESTNQCVAGGSNNSIIWEKVNSAVIKILTTVQEGNKDIIDTIDTKINNLENEHKIMKENQEMIMETLKIVMGQQENTISLLEDLSEELAICCAKPLTTTTTTSPNHTSECSKKTEPGVTFIDFGGEYFYLHRIRVNWTKAREICENENQVLAEPQDIIGLKQYIIDNGMAGHAYLLGGRGNNVSMAWASSGAEVYPETPAAWGSLYLDRVYTSDICLKLWTTANAGPLGPTRCSGRDYFICECGQASPTIPTTTTTMKTMTTTTTPITSECSNKTEPGVTFIEFGGEYFYVHYKGDTIASWDSWYKAKEICEKENMVLAEPQDVIGLRQYMIANNMTSHYWLGGRGNNVAFAWVSSGAVVYPATHAVWQTSFPGRYIITDYCLDLRTEATPGPLASYPCSIGHPFICECGQALPTIPTTTTTTKTMTTTTTPITRCFFGGISYENGTQLPGVCTTFVCEDGTWSYKGCINRECSECFIYNDPHFRTFDGARYDLHEQCTYSLTQNGKDSAPNFYLYGKFSACSPIFKRATCLNEITYKINNNTVISFANNPGYSYTFKVKLNGADITLSSTPVLLGDDNDCLAWRGFMRPLGWTPSETTVSTSDCVMVLGSNGLMIQYCGWDIHVWAYSSLKDNIYGLCGYFDGNINTDLTGRNGVIYQKSQIKDFAKTWKVASCPSVVGKRQSQQLSCDDISTFGEYKKMCADNIQNLDMTDTEQRDTIESCAFDMCVVFNSGSTDPSPQDWLDRIKQSAVRQIAINIATPRNPNLEWNTVDSDLFVRFDRQEYWNDARAVCQEFGLELYQPRNPMAVAIYLKDKYGDWRSRYWLGARGNGTHMAWLSGDVLTLDNPYLMWRDVRKNPNQCTGLQANNKEKNKVLYASWGCSVWKYYTLCG